MNLKKLGKALLFPHISIMIILIPIDTVFLVYSMVFLGKESPVAIISYVLAFYTLMVWCFKISHLVRFFKTFKDENKYAKIWLDDTRLRMNVSLYGSLHLEYRICPAAAWNGLLASYILVLFYGRLLYYSCGNAIFLGPTHQSP